MKKATCEEFQEVQDDYVKDFLTKIYAPINGLPYYLFHLHVFITLISRAISGSLKLEHLSNDYPELFL